MITLDRDSNIHDSCSVVVSNQSCQEHHPEQRQKWALLDRDIAFTDEKFFGNAYNSTECRRILILNLISLIAKEEQIVKAFSVMNTVPLDPGGTESQQTFRLFY